MIKKEIIKKVDLTSYEKYFNEFSEKLQGLSNIVMLEKGSGAYALVVLKSLTLIIEKDIKAFIETLTDVLREHGLDDSNSIFEFMSDNIPNNYS